MRNFSFSGLSLIENLPKAFFECFIYEISLVKKFIIKALKSAFYIHFFFNSIKAFNPIHSFFASFSTHLHHFIENG